MADCPEPFDTLPGVVREFLWEHKPQANHRAGPPITESPSCYSRSPRNAVTCASSVQPAKADGPPGFPVRCGASACASQAKLLRVLQEGEFHRVGGEQTIRVAVRVISATNRDLSALVAQSKFREDLYYRLSVVPIRVPSLRERPPDIRPLADHFLIEKSNDGATLVRSQD